MRERLTVDHRDQQRIDILARWQAGGLTVAEASALLGTSERTVCRLRWPADRDRAPDAARASKVRSTLATAA